MHHGFSLDADTNLPKSNPCSLATSSIGFPGLDWLVQDEGSQVDKFIDCTQNIGFNQLMQAKTGGLF